MQSDFDILAYLDSMKCQEIHISVDEPTGLKAIVAIHNLALGPSLGGCRLMEYDSSEAAMKDAVRLAQGMTYKAAVAGLHLGGAKAVLVKPKVIQDKTAYFKAFGRFVESLKGRYITAGDLGTSVEDMDIVATETTHVTGTSTGRFKEHNPSVPTAWGVFNGIKSAVKFKLGKDSLQDLHIVVQGLGHVGSLLIQHLHQAGAKLSVFDVNVQLIEKAQAEMNAAPILEERLFNTPCDVFAPCAIGGILNNDTIPLLQTPIVAGAANTQLEAPMHAQLLHDKNILYAPDYVINAGGLIHVAEQYNGASEEEKHQKVEAIYIKLMGIFEKSQQKNLNTLEISRQIARARFTEEID